MGISFYNMSVYYYEMKFLTFFISDKTIFPEFIDELKNIPVDNYKTKLYVKAKNYHELMFYFKQEKKKRWIIKEQNEPIVWVKNDFGGWRESKKVVYDNLQLMVRNINIYEKFIIF